MPEPHRRLIVAPGTSSGRPASSAAMRATLRLSSPAWLAQPKSTSLTARPVDAGIARHQRLDRQRAEVVGADARQRAAVAAERGADGVADEGVLGHGGPPRSGREAGAATVVTAAAAERPVRAYEAAMRCGLCIARGSPVRASCLGPVPASTLRPRRLVMICRTPSTTLLLLLALTRCSTLEAPPATPTAAGLAMACPQLASASA